MDKDKIVEVFPMSSETYGDYTITFVRPGAAEVELVSHTQAADRVIHLTTRGYKGVYHTHPTEYTKDQAFEDIIRTKLQTPYEMVHTLWLLKDVSRAFTHQLVRYRIGTAFVQESMRFFGMRTDFKVLVTGQAGRSEAAFYMAGAVNAISNYVAMISNGVPDQDARGVLPTNILTSIFFDCSLRTLANLIPQRLCCQAQPGEWQLILKQMRTEIALAMGSRVEELLRAPYELGQECGYRASFDRPCTWRNKDADKSP